jgi:hypothetical protein
MQEALEALKWLRVAFKPQSQGRQVADSAILALETALGPDPLDFEVLDKEGNVIYTSDVNNSS